MKNITLLFLLFFCSSLCAQPNLNSFQQSWTQSIIQGTPTADFYVDNERLIFSKINTSDAESVIQWVTSKAVTGLTSYEHYQTFEHDEFRYLTAGILHSRSDTLLLLSPWRSVDGEWKKEMDILLTRQHSSFNVRNDVINQLNSKREEWIELANQHEPTAHIKALYTEDASYIYNGQKSEGHQEIIDRYSYMKNPDYQVHLEAERLWQASEQYVIEVGRYFTGAEKIGTGGLYVIVWERQENKKWLIEMDFNF